MSTRQIQFTTYKFLLSIFICFFVLLTTSLFPQDFIQSSKPGSSQGEVQLEKLEKFGGAFNTKIQQVLNEQVQLLKMKQEIKNHLTPETLAKKFVQEFRKTSTKIGLAETKKYLQNYLKLNATQEVGTITGILTFSTESWRKYVTALAFDSYGYIAGIGETTYEYGWVGEEWLPTFKYTIENLPPGEYYVLTVSNKYAYVDEIFDNVPAPVFSREAWRDAQKVTVTAGAGTENINFDLQPSTEFLVTLYYPNGNVSSVDEATFTLTHFDRPEILLQDFYEYNWTDGEFEFFVPFLGDFKLGVTPDNYPTAWYKNSTNWNDADKLTIATYPDTGLTWPDNVDSLDITLNYGGSNAQLGKISGTVNGNGEFKMIFAFKASDLSLASLAFIFYSYYTIEDLEPGEYYVYAEDYLGNISEDGSMLGTFYKDAATIAEAEKVVVDEGQTTYGININLRKGATIRGNITDQEDNPLISMLVVAMKMNFPEASAFNLFTKMHVGLGMADSSGNYRITGLPAGDYILRTLSDYTIKIVWGFPSLDDGPYKGLVVDEFYKGFHNLFDFSKAQRITVSDTQTVENIDFVLEKAKYFKGKFFDALSSESIKQALMVAFIDSSRDPFYNIPKIDYYGSYEYGPLPSGKYRLLATANHRQKDFYLPEFYENATTFEDANVLELVDEDLENIDFAFDRGAIIQGHIDLVGGQEYSPAGADTLFNFPIVLFNATDGSVSRNAYVQFDGGYRIPRLLPGSYKLIALPIESPYAATYYGGGNSFDDPESQTIQVQSGQIVDLNIELEKASGAIEGTVTGKTTDMPVNNCLVIAYDGTGHAIGLGITDDSMDEIVAESATGSYQITALRAEEYYLCTYAFTDESEIAIKIPQYLMAEDADLFDMVFGMLEAMFATDMSVYADSWYNQVPIRTEFNIPELVMSFLIYGMANEYDYACYPFYMPIPFQRTIPDAASPVSVTENTTVLQDINFQLEVDDMEDIFLDVETEKKNVALPDDLFLFANYPNPFNPTTTIEFVIPRSAYLHNVKLEIFNTLGEKIRTLVNEQQNAGMYSVRWDGRNEAGLQMPSGVYLYRLRAGSFVEKRKMMLIR